jgi:hypothetical protein
MYLQTVNLVIFMVKTVKKAVNLMGNTCASGLVHASAPYQKA